MNLINCSLNCKYQQDGLCGRDKTEGDTLSASPECAFFKDKESSVKDNNANEKELLKDG